MSRLIAIDAEVLNRLLYAAQSERPDEIRAALRTFMLAETHTVPDPQPWLTVAEAAALLRVSQRTVRNHAAAGDLPHRRIGSRLLIHHTAVSGTGRNATETPLGPQSETTDTRDNEQGDRVA